MILSEPVNVKDVQIFYVPSPFVGQQRWIAANADYQEMRLFTKSTSISRG